MRSGVKWLGFFLSLLGIGLSFLFLFDNPYSEQAVSNSTQVIVVLMLIVPSAVMAISIWRGLRILMAISLIWLAPYSFYFAIASIPSIWNVVFLILLVQFIAVISLASSM
ncbi:hypothetical protein [Paenibacillus silagei]|uniref:Uncharacterized protein n=1 Tax=Paenibacillus silagei TaxID=1670801 RepID=A0ABS4NVY8_9BACL|nr:hypothetical protein [Paenibacillus silagei]MBP2114221.1 hypothetical protein [Paenibacillus silagei]